MMMGQQNQMLERLQNREIHEGEQRRQQYEQRRHLFNRERERQHPNNDHCWEHEWIMIRAAADGKLDELKRLLQLFHFVHVNEIVEGDHGGLLHAATRSRKIYIYIYGSIFG